METITLIADRDAKSPVAEAYRTIRTNIQFSNVGQELKTIIVTSATPNEGKSTTISNLAVVMAQAGHPEGRWKAYLCGQIPHQKYRL